MGRGVGRERGEGGGGGGGDRVRGKRENKWEITFRKWEILFEFPESKAQDSAQKVIYQQEVARSPLGMCIHLTRKVECYGAMFLHLF